MSKKKFSLKEELQKLNEPEQQQAQTRLSHLSHSLGKMPWYGEEVRDDSRLAWIYCTDSRLDADEVAHEMSTVHFLYQNTKYPQVVQDRLRAAANFLHEQYPDISWTTLWRLVVRVGIPVIKHTTALAHIEGIDTETPPPEDSPVDVTMGDFIESPVKSWADQCEEEDACNELCRVNSNVDPQCTE